MNVFTGTSAVVSLVGTALVLALFAERVQIPAGVAMVTVGLLAALLHPITLPIDFGDMLLAVFLPPLVFEAAWNLEFERLHRMKWAITLLALPGAVLTAILIAAILSLSGFLSWPAAFLFGAIVSATDPVAVTAIFRTLPVPKELVTLVEGESLANDGVAIVLYSVALAGATGIAAPTLPQACFHVLAAIAGGIVIGLLGAFLMAFTMRRAGDIATQATATLVLGYSAFLGAEQLHFSGVFATAAGAIGLRRFAARLGAQCDAERIEDVWSVIGFIANGLVFLATGLSLHFQHIRSEAPTLCLALLGVIVARAVLSWIAVPALRLPQADWRWNTTTYLAGMRGGVALALALALPANVDQRELIINAVFVSVVLTLIVQGLPLAHVLKKMFQTEHIQL